MQGDINLLKDTSASDRRAAMAVSQNVTAERPKTIWPRVHTAHVLQRPHMPRRQSERRAAHGLCTAWKKKEAREGERRKAGEERQPDP